MGTNYYFHPAIQAFAIVWFLGALITTFILGAFLKDVGLDNLEEDIRQDHDVNLVFDATPAHLRHLIIPGCLLLTVVIWPMLLAHKARSAR